MGHNNYIKQRHERDREMLAAGLNMGMQIAADYFQIALRDPDVMGKDTLGRKRIERLNNKTLELDLTGGAMSKPRYKWWGYIRGVVRAYPELKKEYEELHRQSLTAGMSGMPGSGAVSRGTEDIAVRELPYTKQREYEAVRRAIETTKRMDNGAQRMRIVDLVYWKRTHTVEGAAMKVGYSTDRGKQLHGEFVRLVAKNYGLMDQEGK